MARTQESRKADTRDRLIRAAAELFATRGVDAVSIDTIAEAADRTSGAVYAHFGGKPGLVLSVLDLWAKLAARSMAADFVGARTVRARLAATWRTFTSQHDGIVLLHELWLRAVRDPSVGPELALRYAESRRAMAGVYAEWAAAEELALPMTPDALAAAVFALLLGLDMQRRLDPAAVPDAVAVSALSALFNLQEENHANAHL